MLLPMQGQENNIPLALVKLASRSVETKLFIEQFKNE